MEPPSILASRVSRTALHAAIFCRPPAIAFATLAGRGESGSTTSAGCGCNVNTFVRKLPAAECPAGVWHGCWPCGWAGRLAIINIDAPGTRTAVVDTVKRDECFVVQRKQAVCRSAFGGVAR